MPELLKTRSGRDLTPETVDRLADLAEKGFDLSSWKPRRGRPGLDPRSVQQSPRIAVRLRSEVHSRLAELAASQGRSLSALVRDLIEAYASHPGTFNTASQAMGQEEAGTAVVVRPSMPSARIDTTQADSDGLIPAAASGIQGFRAGLLHVGTELQARDQSGHPLPATVERIESQRLLLRLRSEGSWSETQPTSPYVPSSMSTQPVRRDVTTTTQA